MIQPTSKIYRFTIAPVQGSTTPLLLAIQPSYSHWNLAACHQQDVRFVCIQVSLDVVPLLGARHAGATVLKSMYYLELPQQLVNMANGLGAVYILTTFHGPANITMMTAHKVLEEIIHPCLQRSPITLSGSDFNIQEANIDSNMVKDQLITKLLLLGFGTICASVFAILCPGFSDQPHAVLEHIRQALPGPDGQMVVTIIHKFIQRVINASHPFTACKTLPISICDHIICTLDCRIIPSFGKLYDDHAMSHDLNGAYQHRKVQEILAAAQQAEDEVHQVQEIARGIHGQSFHMFHIPPGIPNAETPAPPVVGAYSSQAKRTLANYQAGPGTPTGDGTPYNQSQCCPLKCFGCGGPHGYQDKNGNITCPYGHNPKVKATAEREYKAFCQYPKEKYKAQMLHS